MHTILAASAGYVASRRAFGSNRPVAHARLDQCFLKPCTGNRAAIRRRRRMMHWNKSRRSDHPMADRRPATEFLNRLPQDDPFRLLEEITFWLKALRDAYGMVPRRALE